MGKRQERIVATRLFQLLLFRPIYHFLIEKLSTRRGSKDAAFGIPPHSLI